MTEGDRPGLYAARKALFPAAVVIGLLVSVIPALAQNVSLGKEVWKVKIECNSCHGWAGNGVPDDPRQPIGANLRATQLTREQLIEVIKCGRPGTDMPHFDPRAFKDDRCYGATAEDLGDQTPVFGGKPLIARELNALVDYIESAMRGRGEPTRQECYDYFGEGASGCLVYSAN